ncbi:EEF1A lysine methyltransferase 1 [Psilocybe cubensis]|uniref:Protein-lysine N-methyltransferase EFM5 n=2 Tax=Psilocybe cubensis TaxID=181762 RepID=A0A8H7XYB2_PSICU|nr:EEF1A lysine methyltransferase 1 [Psilocybe cubensis]KAH9478288.1 EEF1A lysine methyltransferase 1 [Psilocybe cubensis]
MPLSISDISSDISGSPPRLDPSTLSLLDSFFSEKAEADRKFQELAAERAAAQVAGLALEEDIESDETKPMVSVSDFKLAFGEDWQLSQFWYSESFATNLASRLHALCTPNTHIAFLCCPTAFVAFEHMKPLTNSKLLEYDQRFAVLSPKKFVPYDIDDADVFPEAMRGKVDIAVVDPPFLNEVTNKKVVQTLKQLLHQRSKLIVLTSVSVEDVLAKLYSEPPLGPLRRTAIDPEHGRLANDFACWGSWDGAEKFGKD